jgi:hypothetical protein
VRVFTLHAPHGIEVPGKPIQIDLRWRPLGHLMNFSVAVEINGFYLHGFPSMEDARSYAERLAAAVGYTGQFRELDRWTKD